MKKSLLSVILVFSLVLSLVPPAVAGGDSLGYLTVINCADWVSLRSRPDKSSRRIVSVPLGASVQAYYYNSEFTECYYNGYHGYILSTYLGNSGGNHSVASSDGSYLGKLKIVNCNEFVTLRSRPSTSASAVTRVALGQTVDAYSYNNEFTLCYYNGMKGYVLSRYLGTSSTRSSSGSSNNSRSPGYSGGSSSSSEEYLGYLRIINCTDWVSLRSGPSRSSPRIMTVPLGASVRAYYYNSEFVECYYNGYRGYILSTYLEGLDDYDEYEEYEDTNIGDGWMKGYAGKWCAGPDYGGMHEYEMELTYLGNYTFSVTFEAYRLTDGIGQAYRDNYSNYCDFRVDDEAGTAYGMLRSGDGVLYVEFIDVGLRYLEDLAGTTIVMTRND